MEKVNDNVRTNDSEDGIVVLGKASVETLGRAETGELIGGYVVPGISED